ncbi:MAG: ribosome silencing factor [Cyanobacteriota bacterium]|nr:ribosome silencing factor [Cyanobacteriota bacterium]
MADPSEERRDAPADFNSEALARLAAEACDDRKAVDIRLIRVEDVSSLADWFVICSGLSDVQVRAIARSVEDRLAEEAHRLPLRREGQREGRWLLLDYGELIVHVLTPQERHYYDLEAFWRHGDQHRFAPSPAITPATSPPAAIAGSPVPGA